MTPEEHEAFAEASRRTAFWAKIAGIAFAGWAGVVLYGVTQMHLLTTKFEQYVLLTERRLTIVEERQAVVMKALQQLLDEHRTMQPTR